MQKNNSEKYQAIITPYSRNGLDKELSLRLIEDLDKDAVLKIYLRDEFKELIMHTLKYYGTHLNHVYCRSNEKYIENKLFIEIMSNIRVDRLEFEIGFDTEIESKESLEQLYKNYGRNEKLDKGCVNRCLNIIGSISKLSILEIEFTYPIKYSRNTVQMFIDFIEQKYIQKIVLSIEYTDESDIKQYIDISDEWKKDSSYPFVLKLKRE